MKPPTVIIEYADMTAEQQRIVDAGNAPPAGVFPTGLSRDELSDPHEHDSEKRAG